MFKKRKEIDEIELGAELYLKHLKESKQTPATQNVMTKTTQEPAMVYEEKKIIESFVSNKEKTMETPPIISLTNPSEDVLESAKEFLAIALSKDEVFGRA